MAKTVRFYEIIPDELRFQNRRLGIPIFWQTVGTQHCYLDIIRNFYLNVISVDGQIFAKVQMNRNFQGGKGARLCSIY